MKIILFLMRESWWQVLLAIASGLFSGICSARLVALINRAISNNNDSNTLIQFILLGLVALLAAPTAQYLLIHLSQDSIYRLRLRLSRQLLMIPFRQVEEQGSHRLLPALTGDIAKLSNSVFVIPFICVDIAVILGCLGYLLSLSLPIFAFTILTIVFGVTVSQALVIASRKSMKLARKEQDHLFQHFRALIEGGKELRLNSRRRQEYLEQHLALTADSSRRYTKRSRSNFAITAAWGNFLFLMIIGLLIFVAPHLLKIEPLVLSGFVLTITYLMGPFKNLTQRIPTLLDIGVSLQKIEQVGLMLNHESQSFPTQESLCVPQDSFQTLQLAEVEYTYSTQSGPEEEQFRIGPLNLKFSSGEVVFIIGGNGSGKSTLARVIAGLYWPSNGSIYLNGEKVEASHQDQYRQHFSTVFSDFYLFETLLGYDKEGLDQRAQILLQQLKLDHKVNVQEGQLSTLDLSQGQRKRLALMMAYLEDRPIYLFDEWAADQDPGFRAFFYEEILPSLRDRGKLVLVISHDDGYFHTADRVVKLDYGKVLSIS